MNIPLYKAAAQLSDLLDQVDPETGELPEGLDATRLIVEDKAKAVAAYILEERAKAESVKAHIKQLNIKVKRLEKRNEWLQTYLMDSMLSAGVLSIASDDGTSDARLLLDRDESIEITNADELPDDYKRYIPESYEPDKALIKKAIKDGFEVPGARLVTKHRLTLG